MRNNISHISRLTRTLLSKGNKISIFLALIGAVAFGGPLFLFAQVDESDVLLRRAQLEAELAQLEAAIEGQRVILQDKQRESISLERDIAILDAEINKAKLSIRARNLSIESLGDDIGNKANVIDDLSDKLEREKASLAQLLRKTNEISSTSLVEIVLGNRDLSDFFVDLDAFDSIKNALSQSSEELQETRTLTKAEKESLEVKRGEEVELRKIQELEKSKIERKERDKQNLLKITKGEEKGYQTIIQEKEKSAAVIRTELFTLRGSTAIPFEKALALTNIASRKTNVRPALILGVIAEESNLGENVGTGNWKTDMKNPRDTVPFLDIISRLGLDPDKMPVSKKPWYGWGGAMGPAQFIPSTWILYEDKIAALTGHNPPNPWDPGDAFMASALLLKENGANKRTYEAERLAALRYFAGWRNAQKAAYSFYGDEVMELAAKYQRQIDILANSN